MNKKSELFLSSDREISSGMSMDEIDGIVFGSEKEAIKNASQIVKEDVEDCEYPPMIVYKLVPVAKVYAEHTLPTVVVDKL